MPGTISKAISGLVQQRHLLLNRAVQTRVARLQPNDPLAGDRAAAWSARDFFQGSEAEL